MNWDQVHGRWMQMFGKDRERWGKLTEDDPTMIAGQQDQLTGLLLQRYGDAQEKAKRQLNKFVH